MNSETKVKLVAEISASSNGLISALKQASGAINDTTQSWSSKFSQLKDSTSLISQSVKNLGDLVGKVGDIDMDVEGVEKVSTAISDVSKAFESVQGEVETFKASLVSMKNTASELGMPIDEYQRFADAVKNAGMSISEGQSAIMSMQERIRDLANGVPEAKDTFSKLGLSIEQLSSNTATANFDAIVQALQSIVQPTEQAKASMELFKTSMEHAVNVSQEYNKLLVEQTNNSYATDKDVQTSIALASAVAKLGEQLGGYKTKMDKAGDTNTQFSNSVQKIFDPLVKLDALLQSVASVYDKYVTSLKNSVSSTLSVASTFDVLRNAVGNIGGGSSKTQFEKIVSSYTEMKEKIESEVKAVQEITNQRITAGAPIDTSEIESTLEHLKKYDELFNVLIGKSNELKVTWEGDIFKGATKAMNDVANLQTSLEGTAIKAQQANQNLDFSNAIKQVEKFDETLKRLKNDLSNGKIDIDLTDLDRLRDSLDEIREKKLIAPEKIAQVDSLIKKFDEFKTKALKAIDNAGVGGFKRMANAVSAFFAKLRSSKTEVKGVGDGIKTATGETRRLKDAMDAFNASAKKGGIALGDWKSQSKQIAGQLFGMGSQVAIIVKGFREIGTIIKMYVLDPLTKAGEEMRKFQEYLTKGQVASAENTIKKYTQMEEDLKKYAETLQKLGQTGKESDRVSAEKQQKMINAQYGLDVNPSNINEVMEKQFGVSLKQRESAIRSQIKAYEKLNEALEEEYKEKDSYVKNDLFKSLDEKNRGKERMVDIRREQGENNEKIFELRNQLRMMGFEDNLGDWQKGQQAIVDDEEQRAFDEALKESRKKMADEAKALDDATRKLREWGDSIGESDRDKNLRTIMAKYAEAVRGGVSETEARNVALKAVNEMLRKEKDDEKKKHDELVKAMEERVKTYKDSLKAYADAQRAVVDAQKDFARTQRELANESRSERLAKRRERLAKRMSSFGFSPYEGFNLNESSSERRERRRNAQIDASIANKMARSQAGGRVHWTRNERERLGEFQRLQRKDKQLEVAQKQMEAAEKQKKVAEQLHEAAKAVQNASKGMGEASKTLGSAIGGMLGGMLPKRSHRAKVGDAEARAVFGSAKGMSGSVGGDMGANTKLDLLHRDLQELNKRVFVVR